MTGAMDKGLAQKARVARGVYNTFVGGFVLHQDEAIAFGVHGEDRNADLAVEDNVGFQIVKSLGVGTNPWGVLKSLEVGVKIERHVADRFLVVDDLVGLDRELGGQAGQQAVAARGARCRRGLAGTARRR